MYISDFHALTIVSLMLIISLVFLRIAFKNHKITAYNLFYVGMLLFLVIGYLLAHNLADYSGVLGGDKNMLKGILVEIIIFWTIASVALFFQTKRRIPVQALSIDLKLKKKLKKISDVVSLLVLVFVSYVLIAIELTTAPLLNIGVYSFSDMAYFRGVLYSPDIVQKTYTFQYFISYLVIPSLFFIRGLGVKVNRLFLLVFLFFSLLTLSKTFFILIVVFYFIGRFMATEKKREILKLAVVGAIGFFLIVYSTYYVDVQRGFGEVLLVLLIRSLITPISLSALYGKIFDFDNGIRSSEYYTYIFGGDAGAITRAAMKYMAPYSDGNSPAGIIGSAVPNVPPELHPFYFLVFIVFMLIGSNMATKINNYYIYVSLSGVFGIASWFLFVTDPLSALNSYGLLYMFAIIFVLGVFIKKKRFKKVTLKSKNGTNLKNTSYES